MRLRCYFIASICLLGMCTHSQIRKNVVASDQVIDYQLDGNQYAVVVALDGISASQGKKMARQRAAEIVVQRGDRYFTIDSEKRTQVIRSESNVNDQRFYGNLYQELIIEGDFSRQRPRTPSSNTYSAIRLSFTSYKQKPNWKAIDACTLVDCD